MGWIMDCVEFSSFAILINDTPMEFFHSSMGLHQGCPLSSYLFILCANFLSCALRAAVGGQMLDPYWFAPGAQPLSHLLFIDDYLLISQISA